MTGNRSLDEFLAGDDAGVDTAAEPTVAEVSDEADSGTPEAESGGQAGDAAEERSRTVEPMAETFRWSAAGETCESCGERVETRWRDAGTLVCRDCKEW